MQKEDSRHLKQVIKGWSVWAVACVTQFHIQGQQVDPRDTVAFCTVGNGPQNKQQFWTQLAKWVHYQLGEGLAWRVLFDFVEVNLVGLQCLKGMLLWHMSRVLGVSMAQRETHDSWKAQLTCDQLGPGSKGDRGVQVLALTKNTKQNTCLLKAWGNLCICVCRSLVKHMLYAMGSTLWEALVPATVMREQVPMTTWCTPPQQLCVHIFVLQRN